MNQPQGVLGEYNHPVASTSNPQTVIPPSHVGWAVAALVFFFPFAFVAFTHALNVFPLWAQGDVHGAHEASKKVKFWGCFSLIAYAVTNIIILLAVIVIRLTVNQ